MKFFDGYKLAECKAGEQKTAFKIKAAVSFASYLPADLLGDEFYFLRVLLAKGRHSFLILNPYGGVAISLKNRVYISERSASSNLIISLHCLILNLGGTLYFIPGFRRDQILFKYSHSAC